MICTYLNSHLLAAPRKYVLHGLVAGLDWAPFWSPSPSMHVLPCPTQYLAVYLNWSGFTPNAFLSGWLLTNVQVNNITTLHDTHGHTHIYTSHWHYYSSLLSTLLPLFLAGWLIQTLPVWLNTVFVCDRRHLPLTFFHICCLSVISMTAWLFYF